MTPHANTRLLRSLYALLVALFFGIAVVQQRQQNEIKTSEHHIAVSTYVGCVSRNENVQRFNAAFDALSAIEESNPGTPADIKQQRVQVYNNSKLVPVDCGARP